MKNKKQKYQSFQEFKSNLYPKLSEREFIKLADGKELGIRIAQKTIVKIVAYLS